MFLYRQRINIFQSFAQCRHQYNYVYMHIYIYTHNELIGINKNNKNRYIKKNINL